MRHEVLTISLAMLSWGTSKFFEKVDSPVRGLPQAIMDIEPLPDLDNDGIRDRDDPIIDFGQLSDRYTGDYALNLAALGWDPIESSVCLDQDCNIKGFPMLVTVPDGGRFILFHVRSGVSGHFRPWNAGNKNCQRYATPHADTNLTCNADLQKFEADPLLVNLQADGLTFSALHLSAP